MKVKVKVKVEGKRERNKERETNIIRPSPSKITTHPPSISTPSGTASTNSPIMLFISECLGWSNSSIFVYKIEKETGLKGGKKGERGKREERKEGNYLPPQIRHPFFRPLTIFCFVSFCFVLFCFVCFVCFVFKREDQY